MKKIGGHGCRAELIVLAKEKILLGLDFGRFSYGLGMGEEAQAIVLFELRVLRADDVDVASGHGLSLKMPSNDPNFPVAAGASRL